jgi:hypothetical protein
VQYFLKREGKILGPFSKENILSMYHNNNKILPTHEISIDQQNWLRICDLLDEDKITGKTPANSTPPPMFKSTPTPIIVSQQKPGNLFLERLFAISFLTTCFKFLFTPMLTVAKIKEKYNESEIWAAIVLYYLIPIACLAYFIYFDVPGKQAVGGMILLRFALILLLMIFCSFISVFVVKLCASEKHVPFSLCVLTSCGVLSYIAFGTLVFILFWKHFNPIIMVSQEQRFFSIALLLFIMIFTIASSICYLYGSLLKIFKIKETKIILIVSAMICSSILLFTLLVSLI